MTKLLLFAIVPILATIVGASYSLVRPPGPRTKSSIQHFAAGVVFSVVSVELLPDIMKRHAPNFVILGFILGLVSMLAVKSFTGKLESKDSASGTQPTLPTALICTVLIDIIIDGFLVGIGFAVGNKEGILLTAALSIELLSLGLALSVEFIEIGLSRKKTLAIIGGIASTLLVGTVTGVLILSHAPDSIVECVLSFGLAALLFLVTEELLTEAHEVPETPLMTSCFFVGFLLFLILAMLG